MTDPRTLHLSDLIQLESNPVRDKLQADCIASAQHIESLYLHLPFCFHKCHYCDFYSIVEPTNGSGDRQQVFTRRLQAELTHRCSQTHFKPRTIFIGGGTPTLLREELWQSLLSTMATLGLFDEVVEFTVEANPETVTPSLVRLLAGHAVNRMSVGAQSFNKELLKTLERWHDPASVAKAVPVIRDAGIDNVNLDLIFAIPGQTVQMFQADLEAALALKPTHISCYNLTYEPNTAMTQRLKMGQFEPTDNDTEAAMFQLVQDALREAGFEHYEISNWCRPGRQCLHNLAYWENRNWLGCGPAAASHIDGRRWKNRPHLGRYLDESPEPPIVDFEHLPNDQAIGEQLMMRLRLIQGVPASWIDEHILPADQRHATIEYLIATGLLERTATHLRLTARGLFVADAVIGELL